MVIPITNKYKHYNFSIFINYCSFSLYHISVIFSANKPHSPAPPPDEPHRPAPPPDEPHSPSIGTCSRFEEQKCVTFTSQFSCYVGLLFVLFWGFLYLLYVVLSPENEPGYETATSVCHRKWHDKWLTEFGAWLTKDGQAAKCKWH